MKNKDLILLALLLSMVSTNRLMSMQQEDTNQEKRQSTGSTHSSGSDNNESQSVAKGIEQLKINEGNSQSKASFQNLKIEDISNNRLISQHPDEALEYFENNLNNKNQFNGYLANISYDLGEIGHDYRGNKDFDKAAKAYLLSLYYDDDGENLDLRSLLNDIDVLKDLLAITDFNEKKIKLIESLSKFSY